MSTDFPRAPGGFAVGSRVAGYLLEEQIGQGGMAVVFRAHDERLDRTVALKILAPALADDEAFRQRFIRESRAAAAVDDPHIIPVFEAGEASGVLFIAMRYVRGGDVSTLVRRVGPLPQARMAGIVSQVASALDAAHARGLVHRDVKPTNMLLDATSGAGRPDHVYLSDFGLSKTSLQVSGLTATGQFLGTLEYVAPEQIESKPVDGRADQYALACATFELLAGTPPFQRNTAMAMILAQLSDPAPSLVGHRPDLPGRVDGVFARALAKAPADRYQTCTEFAEALRDACGMRPYDSDPGMAGGEPPATRAAWPDDRANMAGTPVAGARLAGAAGGTELAASSPPQVGLGMPTAAAADPGVAGAAAAVTPAGRAVPPAGRAVPPRGRAAVPPAGPAQTERLTAAGPPGRPPGRGRTVLAGSAVAVVLIAAAAVLVKVVTSGHPSPGRSSSPPSSSNSTTATSACVRRASGGPVSPATFRPGPVLTDTGGHTVVEGAAFSPDGSELAVADHDGITFLWNTATGNPAGQLTNPTSSGVQAVAFACNGTSLATADNGGSALLWNVSAQSHSTPLADPGGKVVVFAVAFSPDAKKLATGDANGNTYLWDYRTGSRVSFPNPGGAGNAVQGVAFSPDGTMLATGDKNGSTYLWNTATGRLTATLPDSNPGGYGVQAVAFSPDGTTVAAGDSNGTTYLWDTANGHLVSPLADTAPGSGGVVAVAYSPDGGTLATGDGNGNTYLWNTASYQIAHTLPEPSINGYGVQALAFSPDGKILAIGDVNGRTYLWQR